MSGPLLKLQRCLLIAALVPLAACEGPIGPQGPPGVEGEQGLPGEQGEAGPPGSANVFYSDWIDFVHGDWTLVSEFGRSTRLLQITEERVTQEILDQGAVLVYVRFGGAPAPRQLPFIGYITSSSVEQILWSRLTVGTITLVFHNLMDNSDPGTFGSSNQYRYVIIPGGTAIGNASLAELSTLSYEEVRRQYGIPGD